MNGDHYVEVASLSRLLIINSSMINDEKLLNWAGSILIAAQSYG